MKMLKTPSKLWAGAHQLKQCSNNSGTRWKLPAVGSYFIKMGIPFMLFLLVKLRHILHTGTSIIELFFCLFCHVGAVLWVLKDSCFYLKAIGTTAIFVTACSNGSEIQRQAWPFLANVNSGSINVCFKTDTNMLQGKSQLRISSCLRKRKNLVLRVAFVLVSSSSYITSGYFRLFTPICGKVFVCTWHIHDKCFDPGICGETLEHCKGQPSCNPPETSANATKSAHSCNLCETMWV